MKRAPLLSAAIVVGLSLPGMALAQQPGEAWKSIGLRPGRVTAVAVSPSYGSDRTVYVGLENGGLWQGQRQSSGGKVRFYWTQLPAVPSGVTVTAIALSPNYQAGNGEPLFVGLDTGRAYVSTDDGGTYDRTLVVTDQAGNPVRITAMGALVVGVNVYVVMTTHGGGVKRSTDGLITYENFSDTGKEYAEALDMVGNLAYVAIHYGGASTRIYVSSASGAFLWTDRTGGATISAAPSSIDVDGTTADAFVGTVGLGVYYTADIGAGSPTWFARCVGSGHARAVAASPAYATDREVVMGLPSGMYRSFNRGATCQLQEFHGPVTALAYAPTYGSGSGCDLFEGTEEGLFLLNCQGAYPDRHDQPRPTTLGVSRVAMNISGREGSWVASPEHGLFRTFDDSRFFQHNAFYGEVPEVVDIAFDQGFEATNKCTPSRQTVYIGVDVGSATAFLQDGVYRTTDNGDSWTFLASGWPAGTEVRELALPAEGLPLFAATSAGLGVWNGTSWRFLSDPAVADVTHVAVPVNYRVGVREWVAFSSQASAQKGLWYSDDGATKAFRFTNAEAQVADISAIAFSPRFVTTDEFLFFARVNDGTIFTSDPISNGVAATFCDFGNGLGSTPPEIRDMAADIDYYAGNIRLALATSAGPFYRDFDLGNASSSCGGFPNPWKASGFSPPSGEVGVHSVGFGFTASGYSAILGTEQDGAVYSADHASDFDKYTTGYGSLPDRVWAIEPHPAHDRVVFAATDVGLFVSTTQGATFWPWNQSSGSGSSCMGEGARSLAVVNGRDCSDPDVTAVFAGGAINGASNDGIMVRKLRWDATAGAFDFDYGLWGATNVTAGAFVHLQGQGQGSTSEIRAASTQQGFWKTSDCAGTTWAFDDPAAPSASPATSIRFGDNRVPATALVSAQVNGPFTVGPGAFNYYRIDVPEGTLSLSVRITMTAGDADLYVRKGDLPTVTTWDYRSQNGGLADDVVCINPVAAGTWYIGAYGWPSAGTSTYKVTATLNDSCATLTSGVSTGTTTITQGEWDYYSIPATVFHTDLRVTMTVSAGDSDLYIMYGQLPTLTVWNYRPYLGGLATEDVCVVPPTAGTWYIAVRGFAAGTSSYALTATYNTSCPPTPFTTVAGPDKEPLRAAMGDAGGAPDIISATLSWATSNGIGVWVETTGGWDQRNGSGLGVLTNLAAQDVIQVTSGDVYCGSTGNVFKSTYPDEGQTAWTDMSAYVAGSPSWQITDFLEISNGDLLVSMDGTVGAGGGVWLTGNEGKAWMRINQGFSSSTQGITDIVGDSGSGGLVQYYAGSDGTGGFTRTITPDPAPAVTSLAPSNGSTGGGDTVTVTGSGFVQTCITGDDTDCPFTSPVVWFGGTPVAATFVDTSHLSVVTPAHSAGAVDVTVMNPDTREGGCAGCTFTFAGAGTGPTLYLTKDGSTVRLDWTPEGLVTVERATAADFATDAQQVTVLGASWRDPEDVLGNSTTYYYRVSPQ